jgi:nucleoside-diphosphate-sugar epimerase
MPLLTIIGSASEILAHWSGKPTILTREKTIEMRQKYWLFDTSKIENELGFVATDFETGAAETIAWYKEKGWL